MAVDQIEHALPPPVYCDVCCSINVILTNNDALYGRIYGTWPKIYFCQDCRAAVGCHPETEMPLGRMADKETRQLRSTAHKAFDQLWRSGLMTRTKAYQWLSFELKIDFESCHISWLSKEQLKTSISTSNKYYNECAHLAERRKNKRNAKLNRTDEFERRKINARKSAKRRY